METLILKIIAYIVAAVGFTMGIYMFYDFFTNLNWSRNRAYITLILPLVCFLAGAGMILVASSI